MNKVANAQKLLKDIDSKLSNWDSASVPLDRHGQEPTYTLTLYAEASSVQADTISGLMELSENREI